MGVSDGEFDYRGDCVAGAFDGGNSGLTMKGVRERLATEAELDRVLVDVRHYVPTSAGMSLAADCQGITLREARDAHGFPPLVQECFEHDLSSLLNMPGAE